MSEKPSTIQIASVLLIIVAILVSGISYSNTAGLNRKLGELSGKVDALSGNVDDLSDNVGELTSAELELASSVVDLGKAVGETGEDIVAIEERIKGIEEKIETQEPSVEQVLIWGTIADPWTGDGHLQVGGDIFYGAIKHGYENLIEPRWRDGSVVYPEPRLAVSWEKYNDTAWIFHLRKGVKFHISGEEFTAYDLEKSRYRYLDCGRSGWAWSWLKGVEIIDKYTILYNCFNPYAAPQIAPLYHISNGILDFPMLEARERDEGISILENIETPSGTGPFIFVQIIPGELIEYKKNPDYWGGAPTLDKVIVKPIPDDESRVIALETGVVDLIDNVPPAHVDRLLEKDFKIEVRPGARFTYVDFNIHKPPFDDVKARMAAQYAIDRQAICDKLFYGVYEPAYSTVPKSSPAYTEGPYHYDPDLARQLLAETDYNGEEIIFWGGEGRVLYDREVWTAVAEYMREVGFNVKLDVIEQASHHTRWRDTHKQFWYDNVPGEEIEYHMASGTYGGALCEINYRSYPFRTGFTHNHAFYSNPLVDELFELGEQSFPELERIKYNTDALDIVWEDSPTLLIYHISNIYAMKSSVQGIHFVPTDYFYLEDAYIEAD